MLPLWSVQFSIKQYRIPNLNGNRVHPIMVVTKATGIISAENVATSGLLRAVIAKKTIQQGNLKSADLKNIATTLQISFSISCLQNKF